MEEEELRDPVDLSPAIRELKKLHTWCLELAASNSNQGTVDTEGLNRAKQTVVSISPADRRKELGWYRTRKWETKSDHIVQELDPAWKVNKYHEVYIAGEALSQDAKSVVQLMMHQVAHQAAALESIQSYHGPWYKTWMKRLFLLPEEAATRDEVLGWVGVSPDIEAPEYWEGVNTLAKRLTPANLDLYRGKPVHAVGSGKMYKWACKCGRPVIRTGGILDATCNKCHQFFKLAEPSKVPQHFLTRIPTHLVNWPATQAARGWSPATVSPATVSPATVTPSGNRP